MFSENYSDYMRYETDEALINRPDGTNDYLFLYFPYSMIFIINNKKIITRDNACIFFKPGEAHMFYAKSKFCNSFIHFDSAADPTEFYSIKSGEFFYPENPFPINDIIKKVKQESLLKPLHYDKMIDFYINQLLILSERAFSDDKDNELKTLFVKIRSNMLKNYDKPHDASSLSSQAMMSRSRFYEYYRQFFGTSPKQELLKTRLEIAQALLTDKNKTTAQIAKEVGFDNVEHFTRYYKKYFKTSPRFCQKSDKTSNYTDN